MVRNFAGTALMLLVMVVALTVAVTAGGARMERHTWASLGDSDTDRDGIPELFDLCPHKNNIGSPDRDGDGIKDGCDLSPDGDGSLHITYGSRTYIMDGKPDPSMTVAWSGQ